MVYVEILGSRANVNVYALELLDLAVCKLSRRKKFHLIAAIYIN